MTVPPPPQAELRKRALTVLEAAWLDEPGFCPPNPQVYPHQWLWDSSFHAIAWVAVGRPDHARRELLSLLSGQLPGGMLPHMRYRGENTVFRGPLLDRSSLTQPPIHLRAARAVASCVPLGEDTIAALRRSLEWLWKVRRRDGLLFIVHPWESGCDDSPRYDAWAGTDVWERERWTALDHELMAAVTFNIEGAATRSSRFEVADAGFNALAADAMLVFGALVDDDVWRDRAAHLADAIDRELWDDKAGMWRNATLTGPTETDRVATVDGLLPALVTADALKARRALAQLEDAARFAGPFGPSFVARTEPTFDPQTYWRGTSWPQLNHMLWLARRRHVMPTRAFAQRAVRGAITSGMSEHWSPDTGEGRGATPQTWAAVSAAMAGELPPDH